MKLSDQPTEHLIIEANTYSEFDCCDFAIVQINDKWLKDQQCRLESLKAEAGFRNYTSETFEDLTVNFHTDDCDIIPNSYELLDGRNYSFIELDTEELEFLSVPQEPVTSKRLILFRDGSAHFVANGIETDEEFWTKEFPLNEIIRQILTRKM